MPTQVTVPVVIGTPPFILALGPHARPRCAAIDCAAQSAVYRDVTAARLPDLAGRCMDAASGDADGDGDIDLALAMEFEPNVLLLNDGAGINELLLCNRASSGAPGRAATSGGQLRLLSR